MCMHVSHIHHFNLSLFSFDSRSSLFLEMHCANAGHSPPKCFPPSQMCVHVMHVHITNSLFFGGVLFEKKWQIFFFFFVESNKTES